MSGSVGITAMSQSTCALVKRKKEWNYAFSLNKDNVEKTQKTRNLDNKGNWWSEHHILVQDIFSSWFEINMYIGLDRSTQIYTKWQKLHANPKR